MFACIPDPHCVQAVHSGRWVILDNLHLAPTDVLALLESLVSTRMLHIPQRGEVVKAHPQFALFATAQTSGGEGGTTLRHALPRALLSPWWYIRLPAARREDQLSVLAGRFPSVTALLLPIMAMVHLVSLVMRPPSPSCSSVADAVANSDADKDPGPGGWQPWAEAVEQVMKAAGLHRGQLMLAVGKPVGMHDLVKICARIIELGRSAVGAGLRNLHGVNPMAVGRSDVCKLSVDIRGALLAEVADVLCGCTVGVVCCPIAYSSCVQWCCVSPWYQRLDPIHLECMC